MMDEKDLPEIEIEAHDKRGRYVMRFEQGDAELTFTQKSEGHYRIDHTGVPKPLEGRGIGTRLVERAVADARINNARIDPACPFAARLFNEHPDWDDVRER